MTRVNDALSQLQRSDVDGIPAFWVPGSPETVRASLFFRVGMADLPLARHGWLHLLEHLALAGRERIGLQVNGEVDLRLLRFDVAGLAEDVWTFLRDLCRWLSAPTFGDLSHEARVLRAESNLRGQGSVALHLLWRYGAQGPGVAGYEEFGLHRADAAGLGWLARSVCTTGNAVLAINCEPPPGLTLTLPAGDRRPLPEAAPCEQQIPAAFVHRFGGITISGVVERSTAATVLPRLLQRELENEIRYRSGTGYSAWSHYEPVDGGHAVITAGIDVVPDGRAGLTHRVVELVDRLVDGGVRQDDLFDVVTVQLRSMRETPGAAWMPWFAARAELAGRGGFSPGAFLAELAAVTTADVQVAARQFAASMVAGIDPDTDPAPLPLLRLVAEPKQSAEGRRFRYRDAPLDRLELRVSSTQVMLRDDRHQVTAEPATAAAVLAHADGGRTIIRPDGYRVSVEPTLWRDGQQVVRLIDDMTPAELMIPLPARPAEELPRPAARFRDRLRYWFRWLPGWAVTLMIFAVLLVVGVILAPLVGSQAEDVPPDLMLLYLAFIYGRKLLRRRR